jgi:hypothetical protein
VLITLRRLRDAGLSSAYVIFFFLPAGNLLFFALLSIIGSAPADLRDETEPMSIGPGDQTTSTGPVDDGVRLLSYARDDVQGWRRWLGWLLPAGAGLSMLLSAAYTVPVAVVVTLLGVAVLENYGWGLFVGMPFVLVMIAAVLNGYHLPRSVGQSVGAGSLALLFSAMGLFVTAIEGLGCLIMLLPLALPIAIGGALVGHAIQARPDREPGMPNVLWAMLVALPLLLGAESLIHPQPSMFCVTTTIQVNAPADRVWQHVVAFNRIDPPTDWLFNAGVAYPVQARIDGSGVGAIRYCEFSTGAFVEPIEIWDEPRLLRFGVTDNPPPMRELTLFDIHPPHLKNFLTARRGQFKMTDLPDGRTLVEGRTWYEHRMWPETYWRWWSDAIIHRIHTRVLEHVKVQSEIGIPVRSAAGAGS